MIYCLKAVKNLAALLGLKEPSYSIGSAIQDEPVTSVISKLVAANRKHYFDEGRGVFISGPERQVSWASNAWAVIAGVIGEKHIAQKALQVAYTQKGSVTGMTPYLHHYVRLFRTQSALYISNSVLSSAM
jgi:alpha-L-rhamnosidase